VSRRVRGAVVLAGLAALAVPLAWALAGLAPFGHYPGPYGPAIAQAAPGERHVTSLVAAVVFDYRGLDTLGEEFILLAAAIGCTVLLRSRRAERQGAEAQAGVARPEPSAAGRALGAALVGPLILLGLYIVTHGQVSPGGGFQGGVILVGGLLVAYAAGQALSLRRVRAEGVLEVAEAVGAGGFAALAVAGLVAGSALLENVLPLGTAGSLVSGGTIGLGQVVVGLEVTGAIALVLSEFLDQALVQRVAGEGEGEAER
jgi:multicomponent Na+:H+ antiporter subunit B